MRNFTVLFTAIGAVLCLIHYVFHDYNSIYLLFYALSVPAWFFPLFTNVYEITMFKMLIIYVLTIASWGVMGYIIDRFTEGYRRRKTS